MLIGNKTDLEDQREVSYQEGMNFAKANNMDFIEASAKDNMNVTQAFHQATFNILNRVNNGIIKIDDSVTFV